MTVKRYVVGFMLNRERTFVVLIRKKRPPWQVGSLNGVGGKVEPDETSAEAMSREFEEETGYHIPAAEWDPICTIVWPDDLIRVQGAEPTEVDFYRHVLVSGDLLSGLVESRTDERIEVHQVDWLYQHQTIPNLAWLIPLAAYVDDHYQPFTIQAAITEGAP